MRPVSAARAGQRGQRTTAGQEKDNSRTRGGQDLATEPSHRAWPQSPDTESQPVSVASLFLRENPNSKLFGAQMIQKFGSM